VCARREGGRRAAQRGQRGRRAASARWGVWGGRPRRAAHLGAHHGDVGVADGQDERGAKGRGGHGAKGRHLGRLVGQRARGDDRVAGQEGRQVGLHADGAHAGPAAAVGDAEGLVQVEVAHVGADVAGAGEAHLHSAGRGTSARGARLPRSTPAPFPHQSLRPWPQARAFRSPQPEPQRVAAAHLGVHVGAVHVDLAAVGVDDAADLVHALLVHAVRGGVGDHERRQVGLVLLRLLLQLGDVHVALQGRWVRARVKGWVGGGGSGTAEAGWGAAAQG
jgi:hypothetical protein